MLPVVTTKDIDDLYKEFHLLKKRVKTWKNVWVNPRYNGPQGVDA
jgi:hypothetical protein